MRKYTLAPVTKLAIRKTFVADKSKTDEDYSSLFEISKTTLCVVTQEVRRAKADAASIVRALFEKESGDTSPEAWDAANVAADQLIGAQRAKACQRFAA
ncbi:hypothetical protein [Azospirillum canadense]|uniref:hypothetical protein n=1 Tax=Azospirillum canadense TaxID=403962 RepID=UPI0022280545|nr:hypothetical protein [Azospirillum canadense]MCW2237471.1 hypothetical protein [Azospirillum canadense]